MSQNVCNICGANYEYHNGRWKCPACGAFKAEELSNEEVTLLYNAAQKLRLSDFDEAEKAYADIIEKFPKNPDGYWGRLLSRYGIKYEEDFDGRKIPTCYATSIESVITDKDYLKATELADQETKAYYNLQAQYIERVRKEWVEKARKEKPYDIFICYKDSDLANGIDRTQDSIAAQELYIHLTEQGYRVFFSRESLRGKVGEKYEPYIFNALSTAKVMLVYGSKSEYITSTWLKNEWTRYEKRLQAGEKKPNSLIVACDGFSPNELPKVLSSMQCFDATSRSFYTDLDAILKKIIKGEEKPKPVAEPKPEKKKSKKLPIAIASIATVIAIFLCILLPNVLGNKPSATITDSKYGVVISADSEIFDKNTSVIVDKLTDGAQYAALVSTVNNSKSVEIKNAIIYDIECDADITKNVTIKVAYSKSSADSTVKVYYVSDDKTLIEEHSCIYDDGFVQFKTNHLSYYVIGEIVPPSNPGGNDTPGGDDPNPPVTPSLTYEDGVLQVGVSADCEPYEYISDGQFKGIEIDILKAIADELGLEIRFENDEFDELLGNLNAKDVDCIIGVTETAQRNELATATNALFSEDDMEFIIYLNKNCNDLRTAINTAITKLQNNGTIANIIEDYTATEAPDSTTITFNANGGSGVMANQNILFNSDAKLSKCGFIRDGYKFLGWATTSDGAVAYNDEGICSVQTQESITLYAVWEKIVIQGVVGVNFDANGGSGEKQNLTVNQNSTFVFPECLYVREGYRFVGWCIMPGVTSQTHQPGENGSVGTTPIVTYYAAWEAISYTATFKNGNAIIKEVPFTVETTSLVEPSVPVRQCYTGKWSNYEIIADDITIYAEYTLSHSNIVKVDAKASQCNATGNIDYWHCSGCNTNYTSQAGTNEATNVTLSKVACEYVNGSCKWCGSSGSPIEDFTFEDAGDYTFILKSYIGDDTTVVIPAMYQGKPITAIAANAFKNCIAVESVSLSNNITSIGANAFENCTALTNIVLSNKLTTISEYAFSGCSNLNTISIPQTVVTIGSAAFKNCNKLDNITVPSGVEKLQYQVFYGCTSLETLTISEGVSEIEAYAFQNCSSLKSIIIPQSVTTISPDGILSGCSSLETLVIPMGQIDYKLLSGKRYISAIPCIFGTIEYDNSFVYECVPKYYTTNNYGMGYWEDDYWAKRICYVPNTLKEIYIATTESMGLQFFTNVDSINIYWNYVYNGVKVDFDYNNGTTENTYKFVASGETYTFDIPTRNGYSFDGWYHNGTQITGANGITITSWNINSDCILTAKWTIVTYTIGIELNGGSLSSTKNTYNVETDTFTIGEPTKKGYEFLGWSGSDISGNPKTITITKGSIGSKSYTANWRANTYTISLNANGGTVSQSSKSVEYDANTTFPIPTKQGYTFVGWYNNTTKVTNNKGETIRAWNIDSSCTLKAEWSANTNTPYTVNHYFEDANTSDYTLQTETLYGTTGASITPSVQSRPYFNSPTTQTTTISADGKTVVNYYYTRESFTVSFVTNGGNSVTSQTYKYEQTLSTLPTPVRNGYTFGGWFTDVAQTNSVASISIQSDLTVYAWWKEETKASEFNYSSVGDGYTVTNFIGSSTAVCIPSFIGDVSVVSISAQAFNNDNGYEIQELTLQEGIRTIGYYAFGYCSFESVQLPESLTSIGSYAFFHCQELKTVTIPGSVESIGTYAFEQCTKLATVTLNNGVKTIEKNAFASCPALTNVALPNSLTTIGEAAFSYCGITTLTIPQGVTSIGNVAFEGCSNIDEIHFNAVDMNDLNPSNAVFAYIGTATDGISVTIGNKVTKIPSYLFYPGATSYPNIISLTFESTSVCESIGIYAFAESMGLDTLEIPNSVTTIGNFAFYCTQQYSGDRSGIKTLVLGEGVKTIGNDSFGGLSYLTSLTINSTLDDFNNSNLAFNKAGISGTGVEVVFGNKVERVPAYIFGSGAYNYHPKIISISFANGSKCSSIGERAFYGSTDIVRVDIPESILSIEELAFYHCNKLESVCITNIKKWCEITFHSDTCVLENANTKLMLNGSLVSDLKNYSEITSISDYAFKGYDYFVDLTIPSNVTTVGTASFAFCQAVTKLTLSNKLTTIGENAFLSMLYLSSVTIPNSVEVIETQGFASCGLTTIIFEDGSKLTTIGESAFTGNKLDSVTIPASVTTIGDYAFAYNTSLGQIRCEVVQKPAGWSTHWNANKIMTEMYAGYYDVVWFCNGDIWDGTTSYSFAGGTGTEQDPYLISTAEQLAYVATAVNQGVDTFSGKHLKLTQDLHLMNREWSPIGNDSYSFEGTFDGANYTVYAFKVTDNTLTYAGLFGKATNSTIQNLTIKEVNIETTGVKYVGILSGSANIVKNVSVQGTIKAYSIKYSGDVGGVVGNATNITQCHANVTISASLKDDQTAGTHPTIYAGGIAGSCSNITNSYSEGSVDAGGGNLYSHDAFVGGIVGSGSIITNCYSNTVTQASGMRNSYAGGIAGSAYTITNCISVANVSTRTYSLNGTYGGAYLGRIMGRIEEGDTITNSYADSTQVCTRKTSSSEVKTTTNDYGTLQFTQTLQSENFIYNTLGWSSDIWQINEGGFPTLK